MLEDSARMLRRLDLERVALAVGLLLIFAIATRTATDPDLWWHLASGRWMTDQGEILRHDPFSYTTGGAVREPTDWLSELGLYGLWCLGRLTAIALVGATMATAGMVLVLRASTGPVLLRVAVAGLAAAASSVFWAARPQMVTFLFTAVVVLAMVHLQRGHGADPLAAGVDNDAGGGAEAPAAGDAAGGARWLWWLVPLFALWSNLHLGWFFGLAVLGAVMVGEQLERWRGRPALTRAAHRTLVWVSLASAAAVGLNPVGPRVWLVARDEVSVGRAFIVEGQPPQLSEAVSAPFFAMLALVVVFALLRRRDLRMPDLLLLVGTGAMALAAVRSVPFFATVAAPILCAHVAATLRTRAPDPANPPTVDPTGSAATATPGKAGELSPAQAGAFNLALLVVLTALVGAQTVSELGKANVDAQLSKRAPVEATAWVRAEAPPGRLFNTFDWGGYLIWELPERPVWIDGRAALHRDLLPEYARAIDGDGWSELVDAQDIAVALVPSDSGIGLAMATDPGWRVAYRDDVATVFVRS